MNLSMSLIAMYMKKYEPECHILSDSLSIKGVRFFTEKQPAGSHEYVYLGPARAYFQDPRYEDALLLANDQNQIICHGADYEELLNDALAAFDFYNNFEQKLFMASASHSHLYEIAKIIESVIYWPYLIFDMEGNLLAQCNENVYIDEAFANVRKEYFLGFDVISQKFIDDEGNISPDLNDKPQLLHPSGTPNTRCVSMYLQRGEERIGFILMPVKTIAEENIGLSLAGMLSKACCEAFEFTDASSVYQSERSILLRFLRGEEVPETVAKKFMERVNFSSSPVLLAYKSATIKNYTLRTMLRKELEATSFSGLICEYEEMIIVLTDGKNAGDVINFISGRVPSENFYLGISLPIQKPEQIYIALKQCLFAINAANGPGIRYCRSLALPYLIQKLRETDMAADLRHPVVNWLEIYDEENNTEFLKTLKIYIECELNQSRAAKELCVHLNTLKYRLKRIHELTDIDLNDYEELFYIQISLAI